MPNDPSSKPESAPDGAQRPARRRFSDRDKLRILEAADRCTRPRGDGHPPAPGGHLLLARGHLAPLAHAGPPGPGACGHRVLREPGPPREGAL
jgi:hypothetical protein